MASSDTFVGRPAARDRSLKTSPSCRRRPPLACGLLVSLAAARGDEAGAPTFVPNAFVRIGADGRSS